MSEQDLKKMLKDKEWYVLKDANNYGPFSKIEVVQMLQAKTLYEFDYVWNAAMSSWKKISEAPEFSTSEMKKLQESAHPDISEIFFRRRHLRAPYGCSIIVHDNKRVYRGQSIEISAGGAGIVLSSMHFMPGDQMFLHFQPGEGVPSFNAACVVVSKNQFGKDGKVKYGLKFSHVLSEARESIKSYTQLKSRAA